MESSPYYTLNGYRRNSSDLLSASMEDYLEMICRCHQNGEGVRINFLAKQLNVKPSSASKMVLHLKESGLVLFEHYSSIHPTNKGWKIGNYLLHRHQVLNEFFCLLNHSSNELEQVEKVEHFIFPNTLENLERLTQQLKSKKEPE